MPLKTGILRFGKRFFLDSILYKNIANSTAHRPSRDFNAEYIFAHPELLPDLMTVALNPNDKFHYKACWILELVLEKHIDWLVPFLGKFCKTLPLYKHDGAIRSVSKICLFATVQHLKKTKTGENFLSKKQLQEITETCLNWLIGDGKVASKAYAARALYEIGKLQSWIYPELVLILQQGFPLHSPGYQAVAKEIIGKLKR